MLMKNLYVGTNWLKESEYKKSVLQIDLTGAGWTLALQVEHLSFSNWLSCLFLTCAIVAHHSQSSFITSCYLSKPGSL
jgi:hypothetical protein